MDIIKGAIRLSVVSFVLVGSLITLAGTDQELKNSTSESISADQPSIDKAYRKASQKLVSADVGTAAN